MFVCNDCLSKPYMFTCTNLAWKSPTPLPPFLLRLALMILTIWDHAVLFYKHISDCGSPSNVKSLYCFCFCICFYSLKNASLNLYLYVSHVQVEVQLRLWRKGRISSSALQHHDTLNLYLFCDLLKAVNPYLWYCCKLCCPSPLTALQFIFSVNG